MMSLQSLYPEHADPRMADILISGLTADSRAVEPGFLYAALPGTRTDGALFIGDAKANGASAVLARPEHEGTASEQGLAFVGDENPRRALALMAARFYAGQPDNIAAVTGTNGKTSVAVFLAQIWQHLSHNAASMGTLGVHGAGINIDLGHTTADPVSVHKTLSNLHEYGVTHLALEASSHGLDQYRLDGVQICAGAFTNLSRDHLDYHQTEDAYFDAKARLFADLVSADGSVVLNMWQQDSALAQELQDIAKRRGLRMLTVGTADSDLALLSLARTHQGCEVAVQYEDAEWSGLVPLIGEFQVANLLVAAGLAIVMGASAEKVFGSLGIVAGVPGRMEHVGTTRSGATVLVDYAHTPDGLATALRAARSHCAGHVICLFGCGGDRDQGKRPLMGQVARELADRVYVTDDNPRSEDPAKIRAAVIASVPGALEISDRAQAIRSAIADAQSGDIVLLAGKGHEQGQIIGDEVLPFDDRQMARDVISALVGGADV